MLLGRVLVLLFARVRWRGVLLGRLLERCRRRGLVPVDVVGLGRHVSTSCCIGMSRESGDCTYGLGTLVMLVRLMRLVRLGCLERHVSISCGIARYKRGGQGRQARSVPWAVRTCFGCSCVWCVGWGLGV